MFRITTILLVVIISVMSLLAVACTGQVDGPGTSQEPSTTSPADSSTPQQPSSTSPSAVTANFRLLISDDANAIEKFTSVNVTISEIGVHSGGGSGNWTTITPDIKVVDLKPLIGENALAIYSGNLTAGEYNKVFIYVSDVTGVLKEEHGGGVADIKLPGEKLHISKPFTVSENGTTSFVYDITVVEAGKSDKYVLQPQIAQSGAEQKFKEVKQNRHGDDKPGNRLALGNTVWTLASYGLSDNLTPVLEGTTVTLQFHGDTGEFEGSAGCNHYFGGYEADDETLTVTSPIGNTEMACMEPEGIMEQEQAYLSILRDMESYSIIDNSLTITCGDNILVFVKD